MDEPRHFMKRARVILPDGERVQPVRVTTDRDGVTVAWTWDGDVRLVGVWRADTLVRADGSDRGRPTILIAPDGVRLEAHRAVVDGKSINVPCPCTSPLHRSQPPAYDPAEVGV